MSRGGRFPRFAGVDLLGAALLVGVSIHGPVKGEAVSVEDWVLVTFHASRDKLKVGCHDRWFNDGCPKW